MKMKKKIKKFKKHSINSRVYNVYYNKAIDGELVYVESRDGNDFTGNILRIVEELSTGKYGNFKIVVYAKPEVHHKIKALQKNYNLKIHKIVDNQTDATITLEKAKYIITDSGMRPKYVKREGQIFINTWHGTPLKTMGKHNHSEEHRVANIQQVFLASDYLLYPSNYMKEKMLNSYMIDKLYQGKILLEGYPRNSIFFEKEKGKKLKEKLGYENKQLFAYMPTFKGFIFDRKDEAQKNDIENYLEEIDSALKENQILLVKLHVYNQEQIDFNRFKHIQAFPIGYEIYDVLNMTDCLITDYSSVFFDYANSRNKIILFNYDEEEYMKDRGTYFPLSDLPFPKVQTVKDLINELNTSKNYDDDEFVEKFCTYDKVGAVENLCKHIFKVEKVCMEERIENEKENILIFAGGLLNNGITSALISILSQLDKTKYNYFICYPTWIKYIENNHRHIFSIIPDGVDFCPLRTPLNLTIKESRDYNKFIKSKSKNKKLSKTVKKMLTRELKRSFNNTKFKSIIHFSGYGINETLLFSVSNANKSIWVHSNMIQEIETKSNQNYNVLKEAYNNYDHVCLVSPDLIEPTTKISGKKDNIKIVHNINNYKRTIKKSEKEIKFDKKTTMTTTNIDGIEGVLKSSGKKFITIGEFLEEKGHERLINAFDKFCEDYSDTQLIIIGGHGKLYRKTLKLIEKAKYSHNIITLKGNVKPIPIIKQCDLFIVPSFYEGWPMYILEADTLDIPIIATDIIGTQWMEDYNGYLVDDSEEGILQGMYEFMDGKVNTLDIDYKKYNKQAIKEFEDII